MQRQEVRVLLASEYPQARHVLREVVEEEEGNVIIGQAENATRALTLARKLRPDIAIIDCHLPYAVGLDGIPLSRIGGLDTAQAISEDIPNIRVILLSNLDVETLTEDGIGEGEGGFFSRKTGGSTAPFKLQELYCEAMPPSVLVFANVEVKQRKFLRQKVADASNKAILFGGLGILGGLSLMLTVIWTGAGVFVSIAGAVTMLLGLAGKVAISSRLKARNTAKKD